MKYLLTLLLIVAVPSSSACRTGPQASAQRTETVELAILGMTCPVGCPPRVQAALASVAGVESVRVDYERRTAYVVLADSAERQALLSALEKQGFGGSFR